jgi:phosphohistidine phosphatase
MLGPWRRIGAVGGRESGMNVYLMRHGAALDVGQEGIRRDVDRRLSKEGVARTREVAEGLAGLEISLDAIGTSPLVRARQTAEIVAGTVSPKCEITECDFLQPGGSSQDLIAWLRSQSAESVLVVGHLPDMSEIASELLTGHPNAAIEFKKAAVCCMAFDAIPARGAGRLEWLMQPRHLRCLRR